MVPLRRVTAALIVACASHAGPSASTARAQDVARPVGIFLQDRLGLSAAEVVGVRDGRVVVTVPSAEDPREIAAFGVVRVRATPRDFAASVLDAAAYARGAGVRQAGLLTTPPVLADLDAVTLPDGDLDALRTCRVGQCGLKLPAAMIESLRRDVVWTAPDWRQQASARVKQWIVDGVAAYLRHGYAALPAYRDRAQTVQLADETRALVAAAPYAREHAPEFLAQLGRPDHEAVLPGVTRRLYWAVEEHGYKSTFTVVEMAVYQRDPPDGPVFAATTQLYATHYFEGAVTLSVATAPGPSASSAVDLLYLYRSRIDALRGGFLGLKRFAASRRIRHALEARLRDTRLHLERQATRGIQ